MNDIENIIDYILSIKKSLEEFVKENERCITEVSKNKFKNILFQLGHIIVMLKEV